MTVSQNDRNILTETSTPQKTFFKDPSAKGVKKRLGYTPRVNNSEPRRDNCIPGNRHRRRNRERNLRYEYTTASDARLLTNLNRDTNMSNASEDVLIQLRFLTLKNLNNLERIYRKIRKNDRYSHFDSIYRNIDRNFRLN